MQLGERGVASDGSWDGLYRVSSSDQASSKRKIMSAHFHAQMPLLPTSYEARGLASGPYGMVPVKANSKMTPPRERGAPAPARRASARAHSLRPKLTERS